MKKGRGSFRRFILTILEKMPSFIAKYPKKDQVFLTDFLNVLQFHEVEKFENRMLFSEHSEAFIKKYHIVHERYYELPYLWFAIDYFNIANRILNTEGFHADQFNQYLVKFLREDSRIQGVFGLVRDTTPLTNLKWEILQYSCNKSTVPLTRDQLLILETVFSSIPKAGLKNLIQQRLKSAVANRREKEQKGIRKKRRKPRELKNLFTLLDSQWGIWLYPYAFDLGRLYFHLQLSDSNQLSEILGFKDPGNTTLTASTVYREQNFNNYLGILLLPVEMMKSMEIYLKRCEKQRKIKLHEVSTVIDIQMSRSLELYGEGKGWQNLGSIKRRKLVRNLKTKKDFNPNNHPTFFISPPFYTDWHYKRDLEHGTPSYFVALYCKASPGFSFDELLSRVPREKKKFRFSKSELDLLTYLYEKKVVHIDFDPLMLMRDFSLDEFWIQPPHDVPRDKLMNLICYLPDSHIISTNSNTFIWTRLTQELVHLLSEDLNWSLTPVIEQFRGITAQHGWYDSKSYEWLPPKLLTNF